MLYRSVKQIRSKLKKKLAAYGMDIEEVSKDDLLQVNEFSKKPRKRPHSISDLSKD